MKPHTTVISRKWREGKVRPLQGNSPHDRPVSRGLLSLKENLRRFHPATLLPAHLNTEAPQYAFFKAWRNLSGPMGFPKQNQTLGQDRAASRRSAPSPGKRTRREDHAPSHRPQMSSGRLFLDEVGRHQSLSPLHRHTQINMLPRQPWEKATFLLCWGHDISTLR